MGVATVVVVRVKFSREGGCPILLALGVVALHWVADLVLLFVEDWGLSLPGSLEASHTVVLLSALIALVAVVTPIRALLGLPLEARLPLRLGFFFRGHTHVRSTLVRALVTVHSFGSLYQLVPRLVQSTLGTLISLGGVRPVAFVVGRALVSLMRARH